MFVKCEGIIIADAAEWRQRLQSSAPLIPTVRTSVALEFEKNRDLYLLPAAGSSRRTPVPLRRILRQNYVRIY
jgi:hypothetical protein